MTSILEGTTVGANTALPLTAAEVGELGRLLEMAIDDLNGEIRHTDRYEFREALKGRRAILTGIRRRLDALRETVGEGHEEAK